VAKHLSENVPIKKNGKKKLPFPVQPVLEVNRETKINLGIEAQGWQEVCTSVSV